MPLYMDMHKNVQGLTAAAAAEGHKKDLEIQGKYGVKYLHYWLNEADLTTATRLLRLSRNLQDSNHSSIYVAEGSKGIMNNNRGEEL